MSIDLMIPAVADAVKNALNRELKPGDREKLAIGDEIKLTCGGRTMRLSALKRVVRDDKAFYISGKPPREITIFRLLLPIDVSDRCKERGLAWANTTYASLVSAAARADEGPPSFNIFVSVDEGTSPKMILKLP